VIVEQRVHTLAPKHSVVRVGVAHTNSADHSLRLPGFARSMMARCAILAAHAIEVGSIGMGNPS